MIRFMIIIGFMFVVEVFMLLIFRCMNECLFLVVCL